MAVLKVDGAALKITRAAKRITELNVALEELRPFRYVIQTDIQTGDRAVGPKRNAALIAEIALSTGEVIQTMRSALDYAYSEIVTPFTTTPKERRAVQFPFCGEAARLDEAVKNRLANRVSQRFFDAIIALKPYREEGGNKLLSLIDTLASPERHEALTPIGDYHQVDSSLIRRHAPDFPPGVGDFHTSGSRWDVRRKSRNFDMTKLGAAIPPTTCVFENELNIPVNVALPIGGFGFHAPLVPTLNAMLDVARETIAIIRRAA